MPDTPWMAVLRVWNLSLRNAVEISGRSGKEPIHMYLSGYACGWKLIISEVFCGSCGNVDQFMQDTENGELVCKRCGLVISDDLSFEKVPVNKFNKQTGSPESAQHGAYSTGMLHDYGMSTRVGQFPDLARLPLEQRTQFYRLRQWQGRTLKKEARDRNLVIALGFLTAMCDDLAIPRSVKEYAAKTYRMAFDARIVVGRTISHVAAASLYFACRVHGVTRTLKDIASTNVLKPETDTVRECELLIAKVYRIMHKKLNLKPPNASPLPFVAKICNQLKLPSTVEEHAAELLQEYIAKKFSSGKDPKGLAASAIYIASRRLDIKATQEDLAEAAQITPVTVRNRYKGIVEDLNIDDVPRKNTWKEKTPPSVPEPKIPKLHSSAISGTLTSSAKKIII